MRVVNVPTGTSSVSLHGQRAVLPRLPVRPPRAAASNGTSNGNGNGAQRRAPSKDLKRRLDHNPDFL